MLMRRPIFLDGPLRGQDRPVPEGAICYETVDLSGPLSINEGWSKLLVVTYRFQKFGFASGEDTFWVWLGWCGPYDAPPARLIVNALLNSDAIERGHLDPQWGA